MGDPKLCLLLLLSTSALALARRYKTLHRYQYRYEAQSLNGINGASTVKNGPGASCMVEIEVPQACSFIVHTTGCQLNEVIDVDLEGNHVFGPAPTSDVFAADMERYPLKVVVDGMYDVKLYPEEGETTTTLNIKRGIISALAVPLLEEEMNKEMPTIHGKCQTQYIVNSRGSIATDISLNRDLSECDQFVPIRDHTSPLALISGMHYPLAQLIRSSQSCNYKFDDKKKHMTSVSCTEKHILVPFSYNKEYGVTSVGTQELILVKVSPHNDRIFYHIEGKSTVQNKDAALSLLRELAELDQTNGEKRAHLFHRLITVVRGLRAETLRSAIPEAIAVSRVLTYQVLAQCGTPECSSAIMQILRTFDGSSLEVDAGVFAMGFMSNPSALLISDMLEMAKYKRSKPIMYALSNVVKRFYNAEEKLIPEIHSVAEFMAAQLGDCTGDKDNTFMTLRVIGNMAPAVIPASPALRIAVLECVNHPAVDPLVQQAAIQAYRLTLVPEEARGALLRVLMDSSSPVQKRVAAYLMLMKDFRPTELGPLLSVLGTEENPQFRSYVESHLSNIVSSTEPEKKELRHKIRNLLLVNEISPIIHPTKFSRNYKMGSVEGNMIFEGDSFLPKEVMLEMTLKAFGFDIDMLEIGIDGKGFEPTVEALFGKNGFFPDTTMKTMYYMSDNMPQRINNVLQNCCDRWTFINVLGSQNFMRDIGENVNKLVSELKMAQSPEAMVYLRLLGNELGYLTTTDMEGVANTAAVMVGSMFKMFQTDLIKALMTKTDNTIFAHYIFMDNEFFLPTVTGMPLRIALSGTFTPGIKGGLKITRDMGEVSFLPSAGVEFVTHVGAHIPEYVNSGLEMYTNIFHESGLRAKISMEQNGVKLTVPAPSNPTKLFKITNNMVALTGSQMTTMSPMVMDMVVNNKCTPVFAGMRSCTSMEYVDASSHESAPYFPFTGDSKFVMELHPTGEVTEYTATIGYELLREGDDGRHKVDSVKFVLRAEGNLHTSKKNVVTADIQIPDYDVEAGVRMGVIDGNTKGKGTHSITLDFVNKNIPQLSLVARKGMLQVQLLVPSVDVDATLTAKMERGQELELELQSEVKVMDVTSEQKISLKYEDSKIKAEFKSDMNTDTSNFPTSEMFEKYGNEILDLQVGETDVKVRHVFKNFAEAANNYMEKNGAYFPYIQHFRVPDMPEISLPETLFINTESEAVYHFNNERYTFTIPLPFGGKSADELRFPPFLSTPKVSLPEFGLEIVSMEVPIPRFVVPKMVTLSIPLFGKAEVSALLKSNLYDIEASVSAGKEFENTPSYAAKFDVKGTSPLDILSVKLEGSGMLATADSIKVQLQSSVVHKFVEATFVITEDVSVRDKIYLRSEHKVEAKSPLGLNFNVEHNCQTGIRTGQLTAENYVKGVIMTGPMYGEASLDQSFTISPFARETMITSNLQLDSNIMQASNTFTATIAKGEMSVVSNTKAFNDVLMHFAELSYKDNKLSFKHDANAVALGMKIRNQAEASAGAGEISMKMETDADHFENRAYHLISAGLDVNGLVVNSDGIVKVSENEATHKATVKMNKDGLLIKGTNKLLSPLALENAFDAGFDASRATLSITNMAEMDDKKFDNVNNLTITLTSLDFSSMAEITARKIPVYAHNVRLNMKPYSASAAFANKLSIWMIHFINEAQLKVEPNKMDLMGFVKAGYDLEEIKHVYQVSYADMTGNFKCSTTGKLFGTHITHTNELDVIGLAAKITSDFRFHSQPMQYDHTIRCSAVPFDINLDAIINADGDVTMYGKHSGQLYSKFLMKAQPLAFASTHECRASLSQQLDNGFALETTFDNKIDNAVSLQEQKTNIRMKTKVNEHAFVQHFSVYNMAERAGIEASSVIFTDVFNMESTENQEFAISGFVKYDKNTNSHVIQLPLMENLPVFLETIKGLFVSIAEALQDCINNTDILAKLEALPDQLTGFISQINIGGLLAQMSHIFDQFPQKYTFSTEDMEAFLRKLQATVEKVYVDIKLEIQNFASMLKDLASRAIPETIILKIGEVLNVINEKYDIQAKILSALDTMIKMIQDIDLEQFKGTRMQFLYNIDARYDFKRSFSIFLNDLKHLVENVGSEENARVCRQMANLVFALFHLMTDEMIDSLPFKTFINVRDYFLGIVEEFNIIGKISTGYGQIREMIVKFEADKKVQVILQSAVELIKQYQIEETMRTVLRMVKDANIPGSFMDAFRHMINYLKSTEMKYIIQKLNQNIEATVDTLKSVQYNDFVRYANEFIYEYTNYVNNLIRTLQIPQKLEATRNFVNQVLLSWRVIVERLQEIKVAEIVMSVKDLMDQLVFENLRNFAELAKQKIAAFDAKSTIPILLKTVSNFYRDFIEFITDAIKINLEFMMIPRQKLTREIQQIISGISAEVRKGEVNVPSFIVPFTDLVLPSWKFSMGELGELEIPAQLDIPTFTILNYYTVEATTVSIDDIRNTLIQIIDFFVNFEIGMPDMDAFFGDLTMNFLPPMPAVSFPEIPPPEFFFPIIPPFPVEKLVKSLQVPEMKFPTIPHEILLPCFGKLYGEFKVQTPIYSVKTAAEFQNTTESETTPSFTAFLTSQATSQTFDLLNYKLDTSARIAIPKMSRIVLAEMLKLNNQVLGVDHQASVSLYGLSAQAQAKTSVKVNTSPYSGVFMNTAFIAMEEGMSGSLETSYDHLLNLPLFDVRNEVVVTQKTIVRQNAHSVRLTVDNLAKGKFNAHNGGHKSTLHLSLTPSVVTVTFSGDTDSTLLNMKQQVSAELGTLRYFKFNIRNQADGPIIKNSLLEVSGQGRIYDMKVDIKASHHTELIGDFTGFLSNELNFALQPFELVFEFQNKGNAKFRAFENVATKVDLQNDYTAIFKPGNQQVNTLALLSLNQYKAFYNFTVDNNENQAGVFVVMESEADLDFLRTPINIPNFDLPFVDFRTPSVSDLNVFEQTGLRNILGTTEQVVNIDAKVVYQKSQELSFKSAIVNLNVIAAMYTKDDLIIRLRGTTSSGFDFLNGKLDGTSSLSTKRGLMLANSVSLENNHIEGTHEGTFSVNTETFDTTASVTTVAKIALPVLSLEGTQNFVADTRTKANTLSTFTIKGDFNIPVIKAVGKANAHYSLKLEGTLDRVSMESATRASLNATVLEDYVLFGVLDNVLDLSLNDMGLQATSKITADGKLHQGPTKIISMDVNENLGVEVSLGHLSVMLDYISNNEANLLNMKTNGIHLAKAKIHFIRASLLTADIEIDIGQPSSMGDFTFLMKTVADLASRGQKASTSMRFASPVYTTILEAVAEGNAPVFKVTLKSTGTERGLQPSPEVKCALQHFLNGVLHRSIREQISNAFVFSSSSQHTINVGIASPSFSDVSLRYAGSRDGISASVSSPTTGFLGLQVNNGVPSQKTVRVYGRYLSAPEVDVDILGIRSTMKDGKRVRLQIVYNMEVPTTVLFELKTRIPSILSAVTLLAEKYQVKRLVEELKTAADTAVREVYDHMVNYTPRTSQLSILFRNTVVQYQKAVQASIDAAVKVLRETKFKLPGSDELTTIPEVLKKVTGSIAVMLEKIIQNLYINMQFCYYAFVEMIMNVNLKMPVGDALASNQFLITVKKDMAIAFEKMVDFVKKMESLDTMLVEFGETFKHVVEKTQELVDLIETDYFDVALASINEQYAEFILFLKLFVEQFADLTMEDVNSACEKIIDNLVIATELVNSIPEEMPTKKKNNK
uniref:Apolipoprotein Bb, tandem duplicate 2 n=1 Tax=Takifugu rubripes TaxID=31033 RepID=A0A674MR38_TAKRU